MINYRTKVSNALSVDNWDLGTTSFDTTTDTIRMVAKMTELLMTAGETGGAWFHIRLESETGTISEP